MKKEYYTRMFCFWNPFHLVSAWAAYLHLTNQSTIGSINIRKCDSKPCGEIMQTFRHSCLAYGLSGDQPVKNGSDVWTDLTGCLELAANEDEIGRTDRQLMVMWRACHCDDSCKDDSTRRWQHMSAIIITAADNSVTGSTVECGLYSDCFLGNLIRYQF